MRPPRPAAPAPAADPAGGARPARLRALLGLAGNALGPAQLRALLGLAGRELAWGLPACSRQLRRWRERAAAIPDPALRADALHALTRKRPHLEGAALFAALPARRNGDLLRALVAYQLILEYLDNVNERAAGAGVSNGLRLHLALRDALDPTRPVCDYYRHNPARRDGGFLQALVEECRRSCAALPSYAALRAPLISYARCLQVLALNHEPDPQRRARRLRQWAARERADRRGEPWHELTAEPTGSLAVHGLLALAAAPRVRECEIDRALAFYPRLAALATMLDSYADRARDAESRSHSYIAYYAPEEAIERLARLIAQCLHPPATPRGSREAALAAAMVAMYLSGDGARGEERSARRTLTRAGGALTVLLVPVLRAWRLAYRLTGA